MQAAVWYGLATWITESRWAMKRQERCSRRTIGTLYWRKIRYERTIIFRYWTTEFLQVPYTCNSTTMIFIAVEDRERWRKSVQRLEGRQDLLRADLQVHAQLRRVRRGDGEIQEETQNTSMVQAHQLITVAIDTHIQNIPILTVLDQPEATKECHECM